MTDNANVKQERVSITAFISKDTPTAFVNIGKLNVVAGDVTAASLILIICGFSVVVIFLRLSSAARSVCLASRAAFVSFARALIANTVNTTPTASNAQIINACHVCIFSPFSPTLPPTTPAKINNGNHDTTAIITRTTRLRL